MLLQRLCGLSGTVTKTCPRVRNTFLVFGRFFLWLRVQVPVSLDAKPDPRFLGLPDIAWCMEGPEGPPEEAEGAKVSGSLL